MYINLRKCQFHKDEIQFLGFVVLAKRIKKKGERIEAVKNWPELKMVKHIQVFLCFADFYRRFIKDFSRIAVPLTLMLQITNDKKLSC